MIKLNILLNRILLSFLKKYLKSTDMPANTINDKLKFVKDSNMIANYLYGYKNSYKLNGVLIPKIKDDEVVDKPYKSFYRVELKLGKKSFKDLNYYFEDIGALYYLIAFIDLNSNYLIDKESYISGEHIKKKDIANFLDMSNEKVRRLLMKIENYIKIDHNNRNLKGFYVNPKLAFRKIDNLKIKSESSHHRSRFKTSSIKINDSMFNLDIFNTSKKEYKSSGMNRLGIMIYLTFQMDRKNILMNVSSVDSETIITELCTKFEVLNDKKIKVFIEELLELELIKVLPSSNNIIVNPMFAMYTKSEFNIYYKDLNKDPYNIYSSIY